MIKYGGIFASIEEEEEPTDDFNCGICRYLFAASGGGVCYNPRSEFFRKKYLQIGSVFIDKNVEFICDEMRRERQITDKDELYRLHISAIKAWGAVVDKKERRKEEWE